MTTKKLFICKHCGNIVVKIHDGGGELVCCGELMQELVANTVDAAQEKHVPVICVDGQMVYVKVGSAAHPMLDAHHIQWVCLVTNEGCHTKMLKPGEEPKAAFALTPHEKALCAYEYCNLHGLWMAEAECC